MKPTFFSHRRVAGACVMAGVGLMAAALQSANGFPGHGVKHRFHRQHQKPKPAEEPAEGDPPEVTLGERLFLETRFAQFFVVSGVGVNDPLPAGDPVVDNVETTSAPFPGPFAGLSLNCRSCHFVDELVDEPAGGMRTYGDFARRSPISARADGLTVTPRNSPPLVNASLPRDGGLLFHFDGEFPTLQDLVKGTLTGRNFGWLPRESQNAIANIARVIRQDNGQNELADEFGNLPYRVVLAGKDQSIPAEFRLPKAFRVDVAHATDAQILDAVANLIAAYTEQLEFSTDDSGAFNLSPYDVFLELNGLPRQPRDGESTVDYSRRLLKKVRQLEEHGAVQFVSANPNTADGAFEFHPDQAFRFQADELKGLKIFFREPASLPLPAAQVADGGIGNCIACHAAPIFTDFRAHNTGVTQIEYDTIHGQNKFANLFIPGLAVRLGDYDAYLPATPQHPDALGRFRAVPVSGSPQLTDLGMWNVFANPDMPKPQARVWQLLCEQQLGRPVQAPLLKLLRQCAPVELLPKAIAIFKTAGLRDLSHSAPYMHNGQFDTLNDVLDFYRTTSTLERQHKLRNGADELAGLALVPGDIQPLAAFLKALNEDYQ